MSKGTEATSGVPEGILIPQNLGHLGLLFTVFKSLGGIINSAVKDVKPRVYLDCYGSIVITSIHYTTL